MADQLDTQPVYALPPPEKFTGAGIYAIYYVGTFAPYCNIPNLTDPACKTPIYVGKAIPKGGRTGNLDKETIETGVVKEPALYNRLRKHARSIQVANSTLDVSDFRCRYLIVDSIWIPLGEQLMIERHRPIWNRTVMQGFGNNPVGAGRENQKRSEWDTVHPGRSYAERLRPNDRSSEAIIKRLLEGDGNELVTDDLE